MRLAMSGLSIPIAAAGFDLNLHPKPLPELAVPEPVEGPKGRRRVFETVEGLSDTRSPVR